MKRFFIIALAIVALLSVGCSKKGDTPVVIDLPPTPAPVEAPASTPEPTPEPEPAYIPPYTDKIAEVKAKNSDTIGWIAIPGTNIDYPVMYGNDWLYAKHDVDKKKVDSGAIYSHYNIATQNIVITGHNARVSGAMFHQLHHIQEVNLGKEKCAYTKRCNVTLDKAALPDFSTEKGRLIDISAFGIEGKFEIFAMYETNKKEPFKTLLYNTWWPGDGGFIPKNAEETQAWIDEQIKRSEFDFGVTAAPFDQFITLYTCGDDPDSDMPEAQSRLYFFLKQVDPVSTLYGGGAASAAAAGGQEVPPAA
ncbi:MAG: class B sortase [Christensenellaceae bacterium]|jgi:hypothetical protein|nr:class B sortase [Christensenellaceae bacterium]